MANRALRYSVLVDGHIVFSGSKIMSKSVYESVVAALDSLDVSASVTISFAPPISDSNGGFLYV